MPASVNATKSKSTKVQRPAPAAKPTTPAATKTKAALAVKKANGAKSAKKSVENAVLSSIVRVGTSPVRAAGRSDAVGRKPKAEPAAPKRRGRAALSEVELAQQRYNEAEAMREELDEPTRSQLLDFQVDFLIESGLFFYSLDPVVLTAARAARPETGERLASYIERTIGARKPDVMIARYAPLSDFGGNTLVRNVQQESAGLDFNAIIDRTKARADERVEEATDTLREKHKRRLAQQRAQQAAETAAEQARLTRTLAEYPARWLADQASEFQEANQAAGGHPLKDPRVIAQLFQIARQAETRGAENGAANGEGDDEPSAPVEFVVGAVIEAYNTMALHERRQREEDKRRIRELEEQVATLTRLR